MGRQRDDGCGMLGEKGDIYKISLRDKARWEGDGPLYAAPSAAAENGGA